MPLPAAHATRMSGLLAILLLLNACAHEARRENPLDPGLTPSVTLSVIADDRLGTAELTWSAYVGQMPFAAYLVLRKVPGIEGTDTLRVISTVADTTFTDARRAPDTTYEYRISITNGGGFTVASAPETVIGYTIESVQLLVADPDPRTGAITLRWHRYRDAGFEGYTVERSVRDRLGKTTIAQLPSVDDTVWVDPQPVADVDYLYRVITTAAGDSLLSNAKGSVLRLPAVISAEPNFESTSATAMLHWSAYGGPRFRAYRIWRRSGNLVREVIADITSAAIVTHIDTGLVGNTDYFYQVDVITDRDEKAEGAEQGGRFHRLEGQWALDVDEGGRVRLYCTGDTLLALVATEESIRLHKFTGRGNPVGPAVELARVSHIVPGSVSLARGPEGGLVISAARAVPSWVPEEPVPGQTLLLAVQADTLVYRTVDPFAVETVDHVASNYSRITVRGVGVRHTYLVPTLPSSIALHRGPTLIDIAVPEDPQFPGWDFMTSVVDEPTYLLHRETLGSAPDHLQLHFSLESSYGVTTTYLEVTGEFAEGGKSEVQLSGGSVRLRQVASDSSYVEHSKAVHTPSGFTTRLDMSALDGSISLGFPDLWHEEAVNPPSFLSLVTAGESVVLARDGDLRLFDSALFDGGATPNDLSYLEQSGIVSEIRQWPRSTSGGTWSHRLGVCLPQNDQVRVGALRLRLGEAIPSDLNELEIGDQPGAGNGHFIVPLSFDVGPDERIFVLDAGNGRVQVFDHDGAYITQFGRTGSGDGEFDFLGGPEVTDFAGSIAVDEDGFVYVADVGNRRIQKFAP